MSAAVPSTPQLIVHQSPPNPVMGNSKAIATPQSTPASDTRSTFRTLSCSLSLDTEEETVCGCLEYASWNLGPNLAVELDPGLQIHCVYAYVRRVIFVNVI